MEPSASLFRSYTAGLLWLLCYPGRTACVCLATSHDFEDDEEEEEEDVVLLLEPITYTVRGRCLPEDRQSSSHASETVCTPAL